MIRPYTRWRISEPIKFRAFQLDKTHHAVQNRTTVIAQSSDCFRGAKQRMDVTVLGFSYCKPMTVYSATTVTGVT